MIIPCLDDIDKEILERNIKSWNKKTTIRVGDFILLPGETDVRRVAHIWPDSVQPSEGIGSYYFGDGFMSCSGGLDSGIPIEKFTLIIGAVLLGDAWFFRHDIMQAHSGVNVKVPCRLYKVL